MEKLSSELMEIINRHIESGMTTEEVLGVLCVLGFRVMEASSPSEAVSGGYNEQT